jgi:hypothetical protein
VHASACPQELGDDPMSNMIRQIMALFDEYQAIRGNCLNLFLFFRIDCSHGRYAGDPLANSRAARSIDIDRVADLPEPGFEVRLRLRGILKSEKGPWTPAGAAGRNRPGWR